MEITKKTKIEKDCINCEHYLPHYILNKYAIRKTCYGHCRKIIKFNPSPCKHWTEKKNNTAEKELSLKAILQKMSKQLESIKLAINKTDN